MSTGGPSSPPWSCSGAMYAGVPSTVPVSVMSVRSTAFAMPRSASFTEPARASSTFAGLAALAGSEWNAFERLDLPRIPVDEGTLTTGGAITLAAIVIGTLIAAIAGGKVGERFHRRVDRVAFERPVAR